MARVVDPRSLRSRVRVAVAKLGPFAEHDEVLAVVRKGYAGQKREETDEAMKTAGVQLSQIRAEIFKKAGIKVQKVVGRKSLDTVEALKEKWGKIPAATRKKALEGGTVSEAPAKGKAKPKTKAKAKKRTKPVAKKAEAAEPVAA